MTETNQSEKWDSKTENNEAKLKPVFGETRTLQRARVENNYLQNVLSGQRSVPIPKVVTQLVKYLCCKECKSLAK